MEPTSTPRPGVYYDMGVEYHDTNAVSSGFLKVFQRSPAHAYAAYLDPERERLDKSAWRIGRAWHAAVFEPQQFAECYADTHTAHPATKAAVLLKRMLALEVRPHQVRALPDGLSTTTKEGKALIAEIEAEGCVAASAEDAAFVAEWFPRLAGREVLPAGTMAKVERMARIAREHPISRVVFEQFVSSGFAEVSIFGLCPNTGLLLRIRPDYMLEPCEAFPHGLIIDGKSTVDASPDPSGFGRQVWNLDYGLQAALYTGVYQRVFGTRERPKFLWLAQEKEAPFAAAYYGAGDDLLRHWDAKIDAMLHRAAVCFDTGRWPAYPTSVGDLQLPEWAQKRVEAA